MQAYLDYSELTVLQVLNKDMTKYAKKVRILTYDKIYAWDDSPPTNQHYDLLSSSVKQIPAASKRNYLTRVWTDNRNGHQLILSQPFS